MIFLYILLGFAALVIFGIYRLTHRFGGLINKGKSSSYFYTKKRDGLLFCQNGNWFSLGEVKMDADKESFLVLSEYYSKDKNNAYYRNKKILAPLDLATFEVKEDYIPVDKNNVYTFKAYDEIGEENDEILVIVQEADPKTYKSLDYNWDMDRNHVFLHNKATKELDVGSFKILGSHFCEDKNAVYYYNSETGITKTDANPEETEALDDNYICDHNTVYYYNDDTFSEKEKLIVLPYKERKNVKLYNVFYLRIDDAIYFQTKLVLGTDISSFETFDYRYAKNNTHVYYDGKIMEMVDVSTFKKNKDDFSFSDKNHTYKFGEIVTETAN